MLPNNDRSGVFKIVLLGDGDTDKSSIFMPLMEDSFKSVEAANTLGVLIRIKKIEIQRKIIRLAVWNINTDNPDVLQMYLKNANGAILIYDISRRLSFQRLPEWVMNVHKYSKNYVKIALVGNTTKGNERRIISREEGKCFSDQDLSIIIFEELSINEKQKGENLIKRLTQAMMHEKNNLNRS